jgi:hypothetical protein
MSKRNPDTNDTSLPGERFSQSPAFRRARARLAAFAMHHKHPDVAERAGRLGGEATSSRFALGKNAWGVAMAMKRWHATPAVSRSRAPKTGLDGEEGGTSESSSVTALPESTRRIRGRGIKRR